MQAWHIHLLFFLVAGKESAKYGTNIYHNLGTQKDFIMIPQANENGCKYF